MINIENERIRLEEEKERKRIIKINGKPFKFATVARAAERVVSLDRDNSLSDKTP